MFSTHTVHWLNQYIDMKPKDYFHNNSYVDSYFSNEDDLNYNEDQGLDIDKELDIEELKHTKAFANMAAQIKKQKYGAVSASEVSTEQGHMSASKKKKLESLFK